MHSSSDPYGIDVPACRGRQRRLLDVMEQLRLDLVIVTQHQHVQYFVGPRFDWVFSPAAAISRDGRTTLVAPAEPRGRGGRRGSHVQGQIVLHAPQ